METEIPPIDKTAPLAVPESHWDRILYGLVVVVMPVICFLLSGALMPDWQSGNVSDYLSLMFVWDATWFFFPLLFYAAFCMVLLLIAPKRFAPWFAVRFGVYTGFLLSLHYVVLIVGTEYFFKSLFSASILILGHFATKKFNGLFRFVIIACVFGALNILYGGVRSPHLEYFWLDSLFVLIVTLMATPFLCFAVGVVTTVKLFKMYEWKNFKRWHAAAWFVWLTGYLLFLRLSILQALELYHALPTSPAGCYIATASARGHQRFVGSTLTLTPHGKMYVTRQLQNLKCTEVAIVALAPRLHQQLRSVYDSVGPLIAAKLTNPFLADLAYLMLKPVEWVAILALKVIVPEINLYAQRFYSEK